MLRPEGLGDLGHHPRLLRGAGLPDRRRVLQRPTSCRSTALLDRARSTSPGTRRSRGSTRSAGRAAPAARSRCATPTATGCRTSSRAGDGPVRTLADLREPDLATGASDSPQATLIPLGRLRRQGSSRPRLHASGASTCWSASMATTSAASATPSDASSERRSRRLRHARSELGRPGRATARSTRRSSRSSPTTDRFDHCVFTVRQDFDADARAALARRAVRDAATTTPQHREMMDLEGLKAWLPGRTTGFGPLRRGVAPDASSSGAAAVNACRSFRSRRSGAGPGRRVCERCSAASPAARWTRRVRSRRRRRVIELLRLQEDARRRPRHRRRAAARQLLLVRRREARGVR